MKTSVNPLTDQNGKPLYSREQLRELRDKLLELKKIEGQRECRKSYWQFFRRMWTAIEAEALVENWHMELLCNELQQVGEYLFRREQPPHNLIINIAPGETKSRIASVFWPAWCWVNDPTLRFITTSYSAPIALDLNMRSRDVVESEAFADLFGPMILRRDMNAKGFYGNTSGGHRYAAGMGGAITGQHAHAIIIDDPINPKESVSRGGIDKANHYIDQTLSTRRLRNMSAMILVMQRLAEGDPTDHLADKWKQDGSLRHIKIPSTLDYNPEPPELALNYTEQQGPDGEMAMVMNPGRSDATFLRNQKIALGSLGYASQHGQEPTPKEGNLYKDHMLGFRYKPQDIAQYLMQWNVVVDTAYTSDKNNDETALLAYAFYDGMFYLRDAAEVWLEFPKMLEYVKAFAVRNSAAGPGSYLRVEPKANGKDLVNTLRANTDGLNPVESSPPTKDKEARVRDCLPVFEAGRVLMPEGAPWVESYCDTLKVFPRGKNKGLVDCTSIMIYEHHLQRTNRAEPLGMRSIRIAKPR